MKKIFLLAIVLWGVLAPISYHPDTKLTLEYAALNNGKVWDIYKFIDTNKLNIPDFHYPPIHFYWLKINYAISSFIGGNGFNQWLKTNSGEAFNDSSIFRFNLATKIPLLILGLLTGWLIFKISKKISGSEKNGLLTMIIWFFNPVILYSLVLMGQNDIVAIFLFVWGMYLYIEKKSLLAIVLFALSAGVKSYPIIWSVLFIIYFEKLWWKKILNSGLVVLGYGMILLPWIGKSYFYNAVLNSGLSQRMMVAGINLGFDKMVLIVPLILIFLLIFGFENYGKDRIVKSIKVNIVASLVILGFSHFNPQWLIWVVPFLSMYWSIKRVTVAEILNIVLLLGSWTILTLGFDDSFLTWGIFGPINPGLINFPTLVEWTRNKDISLINLISLAQTAVAAISIWWIVKFMGSEREDENKGMVDIKKYGIVIPWLVVILIVFMVSNIRADNVNISGKEVREVGLSSMLNVSERYKINDNTRYIELSLNNDGLFSSDEATVLVTNNKGDSFKKFFNGYNSEDKGWLRIDLPSEWKQVNNIELSVAENKINDGNLKISTDESGKWIIKTISSQKVDFNVLGNKILLIWWWWILMILVSVWYLV